MPYTPRRYRTGPVPTLGDLQSGDSGKWIWIICNHCMHRRAATLAQFVIRFGPGASSNVLRSSARCGSCGRKGATLQHPGWHDSIVGFEPFPEEYWTDQPGGDTSGSTISR